MTKRTVVWVKLASLQPIVSLSLGRECVVPVVHGGVDASEKQFCVDNSCNAFVKVGR